MLPLISSRQVCSEDQIAVITTYQRSLSLRIHAKGFLEIAMVATRAALECKAAIDAITPSIIYSIRHATELFLKHVIIELLEKHQTDTSTLSGHNLHELADTWFYEVETCLAYEAEHQEHSSFDYLAWLTQFREIIDQVQTVDPDGQSLRYPANRKGDPNLGGTMPVSVAQLGRFALHARDCFSRFSEREC